jgi:hypothetical protein
MALSDFERSTMTATARPSDMGAGGAGLGASFENLLKTLTGMQSTKGLLGDGKNPLDRKMVVWGSERPQTGPAKALSEMFATFRQGGVDNVAGIAGGDIYGQFNGGGFDVSGASDISAPLVTPAMGGDSAQIDTAYIA